MDYKERHQSFESILKEMIELLPSSYNKEVDDTNYYKMLRALSFELADAEIEVKQIKKNTYLETVSPELMYNNFGVLVKLQKDPRWSDEKYRHLIKGVTQSLLKGPTKQSLIDGFKLFTNFKVNIHELYKDLDKLDPAIYEGFNPMFTFALEVEKPVDEYVDQETLIRDANYIVNIIKPAHTLCINIITIVGEENYRKYYRIDKVLGKEIQDLFDYRVLARINERIMERFFDEARDYSSEYDIPFEEAVEILRRKSNGMSQAEYDQLVREMGEKLLQSYIESGTNCTPVRDRPVDMFIELAKEKTRGTLESKYYKELKDEVFSNANVSLTKEAIHRMIIEKQSKLIEQWESNGKNQFDKTEEQWFLESLDALKEDFLRDFIVKELGGKEKLWQECSDIVEPYRIILEKNLEVTAPYCGMDQMESEASLSNNEGIFGWRHIDYDLQLKTSLNSNVSRIGGARLIGPRYVMNDLSTADIYVQHKDELQDKFLNGKNKYFALNYSLQNGEDLLVNNVDATTIFQKFGEDDHFYFHQNNVELVPIPCEHMTHLHVETEENPFDTPIDESHFYFYQGFHEFANFLKGANGLITNDPKYSKLNKNALYFADEPDHVEEMHMEWINEIYNTPTTEIHSDIIFGVQDELWNTPEDLDHSDVSFIADDSFNKPIDNDFSEVVFAVQNDSYNTTWLNDSYIMSAEHIITEDVNLTGEVKEEIHLDIEMNYFSEKYELRRREPFKLNESEISEDYLNGYEPDECNITMYRIINNEKVIIRTEAI